MFSIIYYIFLAIICTIILVVSAIALVVCYPFDKRRAVVHWLSRMFFLVPFAWARRAEGMENVDRKKSYIIMINHNAMTDIALLYHVPLNFRWVSKREVYKVPFFGQFLYLHGDICINRERAAAAMEQMLCEGKMWISRGVSIAIFPEGTRSKDGEVQEFKAGAFMLAKKLGVDILPVAIDGSGTMTKKNRMLNWHNRITLRVLPPISAEEVAATDMRVLMSRVRGEICDALAEIRSTK